MEKQSTLIIVDCQKDFRNGTLAVKGATSALWHTLGLLDSGKIGRVIFTLDWHPINHCSFIENGGQWPPHCIQHTEGALIEELLLNCCHINKIPYTVYLKGVSENLEEYGAFKDLPEDLSEPLIICGIAGDYCVLETIKNLESVWNNLSIYLPGIASIDGGKKLNRFIQDNNLNTL